MVGFKLHGQLPEGATATDLVLTVTEMLRKKGVVGKFVEFYGEGLAVLPLADRATIANMAPEYGATCGIFPVDAETLRYLRFTGRPEPLIQLVEAYTKEQGLFHTPTTPAADYSDTLELDLATVEPSLAGPTGRRTACDCSEAKAVVCRSCCKTFLEQAATDKPSAGGRAGQPAAQSIRRPATQERRRRRSAHGSVVIAAITSCTNTSNPSVMLAAGLLAKKAVERGLQGQAVGQDQPGARVEGGHRLPGRRRPDALPGATALPPGGLRLHDLHRQQRSPAAGGLEGRSRTTTWSWPRCSAATATSRAGSSPRSGPTTSPRRRWSSPMPWPAAWTSTCTTSRWARTPAASRSYLRDIWPTQQEVTDSDRAVGPLGDVPQGIRRSLQGRRALELAAGAGRRPVPLGPEVHLRQAPAVLRGHEAKPPAPVNDIRGARVLALLGDSITTDHISPAGSIKAESPAGQYLIEHGVEPKDFNSYGSRRGNHEVMVRGTFANVRLRNLLAPGTEGGVTRHLPDGEQMSIFDAAMKYEKEGVPLVILAGKEYGSGSSRDWAAKGPRLLGVRAVIAESYERIHRSNLVGMGVLPLQFQAGDSAASLGLTGEEVYDIEGLAAALADRLRAEAARSRSEPSAPTADLASFAATVRIDTPQEVLYYQHGGILQYVLRQLLARK